MVSMESYVRVASQHDMDRLLASITGFHDSLTKEIHLVNRTYVRDDKSIVYAALEAGIDTQVLIQSQWEPYAIELLFIGVRELYVGSSDAHLGATGELEVTNSPVESWRIRMSFDSQLKISSEQLFYRVRTGWLGKGSRLRSEVPSPDAVLATQWEARWRQCSSCCDAWEEELDEVFALLPFLRPSHGNELKMNVLPERPPSRKFSKRGVVLIVMIHSGWCCRGFGGRNRGH